MKKRVRIEPFDVINGIIMVFLSLICIYPFLYVAFASLSDPTELAAHRGLLFYPLTPSIEGYKIVFKNPNIATGYLNTIIYVTGSTVFSLVMTLLAAYVVSRKRWMWSGNLAFLISVHMFFGGGLIPFYLLIRDLGMVNTRWALIIPGALSVWNMVVLRTAIQGVPETLEEAARMDGANDLTILLKVICPVIKAALAVQILFYAVGAWNAWFNATIFLRDRSLLPIQVILREILISNDNQAMEGVNVSNSLDVDKYRELTKYCTTIIATVPVLVIYPALQKYFVKGVMVGSLKG